MSEKTVARDSNGKAIQLSQITKWVLGILGTWVVAISASNVYLQVWRASTDANRFTEQEARQAFSAQEAARQELWKAFHQLPPDDWEDQLRERLRKIETDLARQAEWQLRHLDMHN